jgi:hypothetical protein
MSLFEILCTSMPIILCAYLQEVSEYTVDQCQQHQPKLEVDVIAQLELGVVQEPLPPPGGWSQSEVEVSRKQNNQTQHKPVFRGREGGRERGRERERERERERGRGEGEERKRDSHCSMAIHNHKKVYLQFVRKDFLKGAAVEKAMTRPMYWYMLIWKTVVVS